MWRWSWVASRDHPEDEAAATHKRLDSLLGAVQDTPLVLCATVGDPSMKAIQAVAGSAEYQAEIDEIQDQLRDYRDNPRLVQSPEELEKLEQEIRELTEQLGALITGQQIQHSLDSEELQQAQSKLLSQWPHRLRNHDCEEVWVRTASGYQIRVKARYFRRKGNRTGKRRYRGYYLGLLLLGIHERCTPRLRRRSESVGGHAGLLGGGHPGAGRTRG